MKQIFNNKKIQKVLQIAYTHRLLLASFVFFFLFSFVVRVFASPLYNAGDTLDPACAPGTVDCTVQIIPALTTGSVVFSNGTTLAQDNTNFFWDDTANQLYSKFTKTDVTEYPNSSFVKVYNALPNNTYGSYVAIGKNLFSGAAAQTPLLSPTDSTNLPGGVIVGENILSSLTSVWGIAKSVYIGNTIFSSMNADPTYNVAVGYNIGGTSEQNQGVFIGADVLANSTATYGYSATTGHQNVAIGRQSMYAASQGRNTAVGVLALAKLSTGSLNTAIGRGAGNDATNGPASALSGSSNTFLGAHTTWTVGGISNATAVGAGTTLSQSNTVILGNGANVGIGTSAPAELLSLGSAGTTLGVLSLAGSTSGKVIIQPAVTAGSWTMTLPDNAGTNTYVLQTNGSGVTSWVSPGSGSGWALTGNTGTTPGTNFVGTTDAQDLIFKTNGAQTGKITAAGTAIHFGLNAGGSSGSTTDTNFFGQTAGHGASGASSSNFIGAYAGNGATSASNSNFFGQNAGLNAVSASNSNFFGQSAGSGASNAANSTFIGHNAGINDTVTNSSGHSSILIGDYTRTGGFSDSILLGSGVLATPIANTKAHQFMLADHITDVRWRGIEYTLPSLQGGVGEVLTNNGTGGLSWALPGGGSGWALTGNASTTPGTNFVGTTDAQDLIFKTNGAQTGKITAAGTAIHFGLNAGGSSGSVNNTNFFGSAAGFGTTTSANSNFFGNNSGYNATNAAESNFFGQGAGTAAVNSNNSNFFGTAAGYLASDAANSNFFGSYAGYNSTNSSYSNFFGFQAGKSATNAANSTFIGHNAGINDTVNNTSNDDSSILIGNYTGTGGFSNSILLGSGVLATPIANTKAHQFMLADHITDVRWRGIEYTLPSLQGGVGEVLSNNGSGVLSWAAIGNYVPTSRNLTINGTTHDLSLDATWTTYTLPTLTLGSVLFSNGTDITQDNTNFYWDDTNNRLGVGATPTTYTLEVGSSSVTGIVALFTNSSGYCDINPITTSLNCTSDINLKKNINKLFDNSSFNLDTSLTVGNTTLDTLMKLTPVQYNWKNETDSNNKHPGFIAQDVEQLFPLLVVTDSKTGIKSLNTTGLTPYIVESIQELNLKVTPLSSLDTTANGSLGSLIVQFLTDSANNIQNIFTNRITTKEICIDENTCLTEQDIRDLINTAHNGSSSSSGSSSGSGSGDGVGTGDSNTGSGSGAIGDSTVDDSSGTPAGGSGPVDDGSKPQSDLNINLDTPYVDPSTLIIEEIPVN